MPPKEGTPDSTHVFFFHPTKGWEYCTAVGVEKDAKGGAVVVVRTSDGEKAKATPSQIYKPLPGANKQNVEDLLQLVELHPSIVQMVLKNRHAKDEIYTSIGDLMIAMNPFKFTIPWYHDDEMPKYFDAFASTRRHSWMLANRSYTSMTSHGENHSIIISGESGSGKTEGCKIILKFLCAVSTRRAPAAKKQIVERVAERVQQASPLLETFGNAKTVRNDNSSRFGRLTEVQFDSDGLMVGMKITPYLLEKSRVITASTDERLYHSFYVLASGAPEELRKKLKIKAARSFPFLNAGGCMSIKGVDEQKDFQAVKQSMTVLDFSEDEQYFLWRTVAAIMHLQTVNFTEKKDGSSEVDAASNATVQFIASELLDLEDPALLGKSLVTTTSYIKKEAVVRNLSKNKAADMRDSLCKHLYQNLFFWIVDKINACTTTSDGGATWIALLDIFGFEDFPSNSFEQLCINLANESLQRHYTKYIFEKDIEDCRFEGISTQNVRYMDNQPCIDLLSGPKNSVVSFLDDASQLDQEKAKEPPDKTFLTKLTNIHKPDYQTSQSAKTKSVLDRDKDKMKNPSDFFHRGRLDDDSFTVKHYAGDVKYKVKGFIEKNCDAVRQSVKDMLRSSKVELLVALFPDDPGSPGSPASGKRQTVASQFRQSLKELLEVLESSKPSWVRCIRPHPKKQPGLFDGRAVLEQLTAAGVLETVEIRQRNYPFRVHQEEFLHKYGCVTMAAGAFQAKRLSKLSLSEKCTTILQAVRAGRDDAQVGRTKVFLKNEPQRLLEARRAEVLDKHVHILGLFLIAKQSKDIAVDIRWDKACRQVQSKWHLKMRLRSAVRSFYEAIWKRMEEEMAMERAMMVQEEESSRRTVAGEEQTVRQKEIRIEFCAKLLPMIGKVLLNIQRRETETREEVLVDQEATSRGFDDLFLHDFKVAFERQREREAREYEMRKLQQRELCDVEKQRRREVIDAEKHHREQLREIWKPVFDLILKDAARIRQLNERRDRKVLRWSDYRDQEVSRQRTKQNIRITEQHELWATFAGDEQGIEDLGYLASFLPGDEAMNQMRRFYDSNVPLSLLKHSGLDGSELQCVRSYAEYKEVWRRRYEMDRAYRSPGKDLSKGDGPVGTPDRHGSGAAADGYAAAQPHHYSNASPLERYLSEQVREHLPSEASPSGRGPASPPHPGLSPTQVAEFGSPMAPSGDDAYWKADAPYSALGDDDTGHYSAFRNTRLRHTQDEVAIIPSAAAKKTAGRNLPAANVQRRVQRGATGGAPAVSPRGQTLGVERRTPLKSGYAGFPGSRPSALGAATSETSPARIYGGSLIGLTSYELETAESRRAAHFPTTPIQTSQKSQSPFSYATTIALADGGGLQEEALLRSSTAKYGTAPTPPKSHHLRMFSGSI